MPAGTDVRAALADAFVVSDAGPVTPEAVDALTVRMAAEHGLGLVDAAGLALAVPRPDVRAAALAGEHPAVAATDAAIVEALVVPRLPDASFHYRHDAAPVAALVDKGAAERRDPLLARHRRADARRRDRSGPHAAEDDVLLAQAAHRHGLPHARLNGRGNRSG